MRLRGYFLTTTALVSLGMGWISAPVLSADMTAVYKPYTVPAKAAVSAPNYKFDVLGGWADGKTPINDYGSGIFGVAGSFTVPINTNYGFQADALAGSWGGDGFYGGAAHLFWRDPARGLLGLYGSVTYLDRGNWPFINDNSGVTVGRVGGEAEIYWNAVTLRGVAGWEGGNVHSRGFVKADLAWYPSSNTTLSVGYRNTGGLSALALGAEFLLPQNIGNGQASIYAEGRIGEENFRAALAGLRIYFGPSKTLIDKHRRDDPWSDWIRDNIFTLQKLVRDLDIRNEIAKCAITSCLPSDRRLKRDITLIRRLSNGIGLYRYRYFWSEVEYVGVMAQEVTRVLPDAVTVASDGYLRVDYKRLGLRLWTWNDWLATNANALRLAA